MSRLLLALPLLLVLIFNPALADDDDERRSKPAINQMQISGSSIFVYGNELIKNREDKVFFAAESSSEVIEVHFMEGGDDFLEVMLPYEPGAGTYRLGIGKSQAKLRISELITFGSIGADGRAVNADGITLFGDGFSPLRFNAAGKLSSESAPNAFGVSVSVNFYGGSWVFEDPHQRKIRFGLSGSSRDYGEFGGFGGHALCDGAWITWEERFILTTDFGFLALASATEEESSDTLNSQGMVICFEGGDPVIKGAIKVKKGGGEFECATGTVQLTVNDLGTGFTNLGSAEDSFVISAHFGETGDFITSGVIDIPTSC